MSDIIEIPNFVSRLYADGIEQRIVGPKTGFEWHYQNNVTRYLDQVDGVEDHNSGFFHMVYYEDSWSRDDIYHFLLPLFLQIEQSAGIPINKLHRMRMGMLVNNKKSDHDEPHIDFDFPHYTACYYVNDSEGDTVIFNEEYKGIRDANGDIIKPGSFSIKHRCSPEKGKICIFPGSHYHASSKPTRDIPRVVLTINFS